MIAEEQRREVADAVMESADVKLLHDHAVVPRPGWLPASCCGLISGSSQPWCCGMEHL